MQINAERDGLCREAYQTSFEGFGNLHIETETNHREILAPSDYVLLKDPRQKIETPLDSRGLVDIPLLIDAVCEYVVEDYEWRGEEDGHHVYWFDKLYTKPNLFNQNPERSKTFRSLHLHIVNLPRELHDFLHVVTQPVEVPEEEVMQYRIESWDIAVSLFNHINIIKSKKFLTNEEAATRVNKKILSYRFKAVEKAYNAALKIPEEFIFFDLSPVELIIGSEKVEHVKQKDIDRAKKVLSTVSRTKAKKSISRSDAISISEAA